MWTPQPVQAWRWIAAEESTTFSLLSLAVTLRLSRGTTATMEKSAPAGFQHLVQPQTWLWALWPLMVTSTASCLQLQWSLPPPKLTAAGFTPASTEGWIDTLLAMMVNLP